MLALCSMLLAYLCIMRTIINAVGPYLCEIATLFFLVLYQQDQDQISNFNILVLPQILFTIFTSVDFLDYGTLFQL